MKNIRFCILFFLLFSSILYAKDNPVKISPLPMASSLETTKIFSSFVRYVSQITNRQVELDHFDKYDKILESFNNNFLDLAYLGPLPYATLRLKNPNIIPLVGFYEKGGAKGYSCVLAHFIFDKIDVSQLKNKTIALTQPLSTCGYFVSSKLLKTLDNNLSIEDMKYRYVGTHTGVAQSILKGDFLLGGMKDSVAARHSSLGIKILATSPLLPSFILVANENTLTKEFIKSLKEKLLQTPKSIYSSWGKKISHGMFEVSEDDFAQIVEQLKKNKIPSKGNF